MNLLKLLSYVSFTLALLAMFSSFQNYREGIEDHFSFPTLFSVFLVLSVVVSIVDTRLTRIEKQLESKNK